MMRLQAFISNLEKSFQSGAGNGAYHRSRVRAMVSSACRNVAGGNAYPEGWMQSGYRIPARGPHYPLIPFASKNIARQGR
jgi:hypothetical protein